MHIILIFLLVWISYVLGSPNIENEEFLFGVVMGAVFNTSN